MIRRLTELLKREYNFAVRSSQFAVRSSQFAVRSSPFLHSFSCLVITSFPFSLSLCRSIFFMDWWALYGEFRKKQPVLFRHFQDLRLVWCNSAPISVHNIHMVQDSPAHWTSSQSHINNFYAYGLLCHRNHRQKIIRPDLWSVCLFVLRQQFFCVAQCCIPVQAVQFADAHNVSQFVFLSAQAGKWNLVQHIALRCYYDSYAIHSLCFSSVLCRILYSRLYYDKQKARFIPSYSFLFCRSIIVYAVGFHYAAVSFTEFFRFILAQSPFIP